MQVSGGRGGRSLRIAACVRRRHAQLRQEWRRGLLAARPGLVVRLRRRVHMHRGLQRRAHRAHVHPDAGANAGADAGTDTGAYAGTDTGADFGTDTGANSGTDNGTNASADATDAGTDTGADGGADACANSGRLASHHGGVRETVHLRHHDGRRRRVLGPR